MCVSGGCCDHHFLFHFRNGTTVISGSITGQLMCSVTDSKLTSMQCWLLYLCVYLLALLHSPSVPSLPQTMSICHCCIHSNHAPQRIDIFVTWCNNRIMYAAQWCKDGNYHFEIIKYWCSISMTRMNTVCGFNAFVKVLHTDSRYQLKSCSNHTIVTPHTLMF